MPVNYLVPAGLIICVCLLYKNVFAVFQQWKNIFRKIKPQHYLLIVPFALVLLLNTLLPPQHGDSQGYHFSTALWIEQFKIVPGLANIHGRFGFNSSFFTPTAAFSFSDVFGQAVYSVNVIFIGMFYGWLLNRIFVIGNWQKVIYLLIALFMFRALMLGMNSPTPDAIASIIVVFVFVRLMENATKTFIMDKTEAILIICIAAFALTVKLNTAPLVLAVVYLFIAKKLYLNNRTLIFLFSSIAIIVAPWLLRNYIISGYFVFPVAFTGFLKPGWQLPLEALQFEKLLINNGPKMFSEDWQMLDSLSFFQWFPQWVSAHTSVGEIINLSSAFIAFVLGFIGLVYFIKKKDFTVFKIIGLSFVGLLFWLINSPDYRFGYPYIISLIAVVLFPVLLNKQITSTWKNAISFTAVVVCIFYSVKVILMLQPYPISTYIVKPLKQMDYFKRNDLSTFPFINLSNGVVMYIDDEAHNCINAPLPCFPRHFPGIVPTQIKMRGNKIENGFETINK